MLFLHSRPSRDYLKLENRPRPYIYILWGSPDKIEQGYMRINGREETVPYKTWTCDGRRFTFIDPAATGDFRPIGDDEKVK